MTSRMKMTSKKEKKTQKRRDINFSGNSLTTATVQPFFSPCLLLIHHIYQSDGEEAYSVP